MHTNTYPLQSFEKTTAPLGERQYVYKLRDLPESEKPREKLMAQGSGALTITELVAVVLNAGTTKEDVLSMSGRIIREYGERSFASVGDPRALSETLGIPIVKACQIVAASELGRRFYRRGGGRSVKVRNAKDVSSYVRDMHEISKECLRGIYMNNHHQIIHDEVLSIGTVDANIIHPREVWKPAIEYGASAVILVHNHPSGVVTPSGPDIEITKQLVEAGKVLGIPLLDHVIVGAGKHASIPANYE